MRDVGCRRCEEGTGPDILREIDATVEGRCAGPGYTAPITAGSPSAWWCSQDCQEAWQRQHATRPEQVRDPLFWLPGPPADPENPTMADLDRGIDLTPYVVSFELGSVEAEREGRRS